MRDDGDLHRRRDGVPLLERGADEVGGETERRERRLLDCEILRRELGRVEDAANDDRRDRTRCLAGG